EESSRFKWAHHFAMEHGAFLSGGRKSTALQGIAGRQAWANLERKNYGAGAVEGAMAGKSASMARHLAASSRCWVWSHTSASATRALRMPGLLSDPAAARRRCASCSG